MIISNLTGVIIQYNVQDASGKYNDGGAINPQAYVELAPRGEAPFRVTWLPSITLSSVPSPAIVTYWRCGNVGGGGFSE